MLGASVTDAIQRGLFCKRWAISRAEYYDLEVWEVAALTEWAAAQNAAQKGARRG